MKKYVLGAALGMTMLGVVGCQASADQEVSQQVSQEESSPQVDQKVDEEDKKEDVATGDPGSLVIYSAGPGGLSQKLADAFEEETGVKVELFQGTTGSVIGRLESEMSNPIADVVVLASWPSGMDLKERGLLLQYEEAENADLLYEGYNDDNYLFGYSASALGITYNTLLVEEIGTDWYDFTEEEYRGMVTMPDPSQSGSALDFIAGYISNHPEDGWDLFEAYKANDILIDGANRPALDAVVTGAKGIVLAGVDYMAYGDMAKGEPINIIYPTSGTVVNPRPAMILESSKNVENAKLYIDFILSDKAQEMVADAYIIPGRKDIPVHEDRLGLDEIPQFEIDWEWMMQEQENVNETFQQINTK